MRDIADNFRAARPKLRGGYVLCFRGEAIGWLQGPLPSVMAGHFMTGVQAIPEYRNAPIFIADGEPKCSARRWERMTNFL